jgi:hypothetical protein
MVRSRALPLLAWAIVLAFGAPPVPAQSDEETEASREYAIKAAYLYNFGRYVEWPPDAFESSGAPFVIGVLGKDPFGTILDEIAANKRIEGRRIVARRFATMAEYTPCQILFVAASASPQQKAEAIKMARESAVLLVGEGSGFAKQGAAVNFFIESNRVRFEINTEAARRGQLKISSKLLSLAKIVGNKN